MPIKTVTTSTSINDYINNCSSIDELYEIINKCQFKIKAMKNAKLIANVEQMASIAAEIAKDYPWENAPFYDSENDELIPWSDIEGILLNYLDEKNN